MANKAYTNDTKVALKCTDRDDDKLAKKYTEHLMCKHECEGSGENKRVRFKHHVPHRKICNLCVISTSPVDESHLWNNDDEFEPLHQQVQQHEAKSEGLTDR